MFDLLLRSLMGGLGVALVAGPLGCFVVWRRMAYFGDTLAHSALLGIALGLILQINTHFAAAILCVLLAVGLTLLLRQRVLASDTLLGILAHSSLSMGVVALSLIGPVNINLQSYLFGDLLAISSRDLFWIYGGGVIVLGVLWRFWQQLIMITIHEDLAKVEGLAVEKYKFLLIILISVVIAVAMKIVGVLLITALLIIPAATARKLSTTPQSMAIRASLLGCLSVLGGLMLSWFMDTPAGPSVVLCAFGIFVLSLLIAYMKQD